MRFPVCCAPLLTRAAVLFLWLAAAADISAEPLSRVVALMDSTSAALADARLELAQARAEYTSGRVLPNPTLFAEQETWDDNAPTETTLGVRQELGFLWSQRPRQTALRHRYAAAKEQYTERRRELLADAIVSAYDYAGYRQLTTLLDSVLLRMHTLNAAIAARRAEGDVSRFEEQRFGFEVLEMEHRRQNMLIAREAALDEFVALTGLPAARLRDVELDIAVTVPDLTRDEAERLALERRPQFAAAKRDLAAAKSARTSARLMQLPEFAVGAGRKTANDGLSGMLVEGELEIPLFGQRRSQAQLAAIAERHAAVRLASAEADARRAVNSAYNRWESLQTFRFAEAQAAADSADVNTMRAAALYLDGEISAVELVDALRTGIDARAATIDLRNALIAAALDFRRAIGLDPLEQQP